MPHIILSIIGTLHKSIINAQSCCASHMQEHKAQYIINIKSRSQLFKLQVIKDMIVHMRSVAKLERTMRQVHMQCHLGSPGQNHSPN